MDASEEINLREKQNVSLSMSIISDSFEQFDNNNQEQKSK